MKKLTTLLALALTMSVSAKDEITITVHADKPGSVIDKNIYGQFSEHLGTCIYGGLWVGEDSDIPNTQGYRNDVLEALKELEVPVMRWPGGCFADEYHWMDGIGPKENRPRMVNNNWGGIVEDNSFGTHEFLNLCEILGCEPYISLNVGSGSVQEAAQWIEYMNAADGPMARLRKQNGREEPWKVKYIGIGNEAWGCGGNMTPEHYANEYRRYQTYVRSYDGASPIQKVCCGANVDDYHWTEGVMKTCFDHVQPQFHGFMDHISLHYYVHPEGWEIKGSATDFDDEVWYKTLNKALYMETLINRHSAIIDQYDPEKKIGLCVDEWGTWFTCEPGTNPGFLYQQSTVRDALVAGITLNIFNKHCDRVKIACIAQLGNVLQSVILTEGEKMIKTPTYHVFHMYRHHQGAELLDSALSGVEEIGIGEWKVPAVTESVSKKDGVMTITLNNLSTDAANEIDVVFDEDRTYEVVEANIVTNDDMRAHNTFDAPEVVKEEAFTAYSVSGNTMKVTLPACSVVEIRVK